MLLSAAVGGYSGSFTKLSGLQPRGVAMASGQASQPALSVTGVTLNSTMADRFTLEPPAGKSFIINSAIFASISAVDGNLAYEVWIDGVKVLEQPATALVTTGGVVIGGNGLVQSYSNTLVNSSFVIKASKTATAATFTINCNYVQV